MTGNLNTRALAAFGCGILFGLGLAIAQLTNPAKVLAFFDIAAMPTGGWDPSLALVLGGAVVVTLIAFRLLAVPGRQPLLDRQFRLPEKTDIDIPLVVGSAIYGIGWGLAGYCVGPAIAALAFGDLRVVVFVAAMAVGLRAGTAIERLMLPPRLHHGGAS